MANSDDTKLTSSVSQDDLEEKLLEEELEDEEDAQTSGEEDALGSAADLESDDDPEAVLESMVGEIDNTKPFTLGDRFNADSSAIGSSSGTSTTPSGDNDDEEEEIEE